MNDTDLLVVCTGNVCRSPLVERLLQGVLDDRYGPGAVRVRSAGTMGLEGSAMDERSAGVLAGLGGTHEGFVARRLTPALLQQARLVLTATTEHRTAVSRLDPRSMKRTFTVRELAAIGGHLPDEALPSAADPVERLTELAQQAKALRGVHGVPLEDLDVVDPYRREDAVYDRMREEVSTALPAVARLLRGRPD